MKLLFLRTLIILVLTSHAHSKGILLFKRRAMDPSSSPKVIEYISIEKFSTVYNVVDGGGKPYRINSSLVVADIPLPDLAEVYPTITDVRMANEIRNLQSSTNKAIETWPKIKQYVVQFQDDLGEHVKFLDQEFVKIRNEWIPEAQFSATQKKGIEGANEVKQEFAEAAEKRAADKQAALDASYSKIQRYQSDLRSLLVSANRKLDEIKQRLSSFDLIENKSGASKKTFRLLRKVTRSGFGEAYEYATYAFQAQSDTGETSILACESFADLSSEIVKVWVISYGDRDVSMVGGEEERIPLYVETPREMSDILESAEAASRDITQIEKEIKKQQVLLDRLVEQGAAANP